MAATKLSGQDKKDLEKFTKYLVYKCIQIIVQSRLGERIRTQSKPFSNGSDWFNLAIRDIPEVLGETKKVLSTQNEFLSLTQSICVEISLKTAEGDTMILETWWLSVADIMDSSARVSYTVYSRMGILLKSLLSVTRVTPAYQLSRKQGPETYVICYRIYLGDPQTICLGDSYQALKVGTVPTPLGSVVLHVAYRTKLLISPQKTCRDLSADLKDDHFTYRPSEFSPKRTNTPKPCHLGFTGHRGVSEELSAACGECGEQEVCNSTFSTSPADPASHHNFFLTPSPPHRVIGHSQSPPQRTHRRHSCDNKADSHKINGHGNLEKQSGLNSKHKVGAFVSQKDSEHSKSEEDIPFLSLLQHEKMSNGEVGIEERSRQDAKDTTDGALNLSCGSGSNKSTSSLTSAPDDFVLVELKTPFATTDANTDLGKFYRDCQVAPPLSMFDSQPSIEDTLTDISDQLATFEVQGRDFDDFVNALQITEGSE